MQLKDCVSSLEHELGETKDSLRKTEVKLAIITEYFQQKEMDLHSKLEVGEQARKKVELYANEAEDKDRARAEERVKEKDQLDRLRQQMKDLELTYVTQVKNHEKRATEATVSFVGVVFCFFLVLCSHNLFFLLLFMCRVSCSELSRS